MIDPICGMTVEPGNAAGKHVYNGQTYYFCSQHCLAKFKEDPEKFLKSPASGSCCARPRSCARTRGCARSSSR